MIQLDLIYPQIDDCLLRPLEPEDAPALARLSLACAAVDGDSNLITLLQYQHKFNERYGWYGKNSVAFVRDDGEILAYGWVTHGKVTHEHHYFLEGSIHPQVRQRGVGRFLLRWMEFAARRNLAVFNDGLPKLLKIGFYDITDTAKELYEAEGYEFGFAEDTMQRDLNRVIPQARLSNDLSFAYWTPQSAALFFAVYDDAFRDRAGFPGWTEPIWRAALTENEAFRPDLSLLLMFCGEPIGFVISHIEPHKREIGWVAQMGVRQVYRNRGLGSGILSEVMRRFRSEHLKTAMLNVNVNNRTAHSVYRRLGFQITKRYSSYQKSV